MSKYFFCGKRYWSADLTVLIVFLLFDSLLFISSAIAQPISTGENTNLVKTPDDSLHTSKNHQKAGKDIYVLYSWYAMSYPANYLDLNDTTAY